MSMSARNIPEINPKIPGLFNPNRTRVIIIYPTVDPQVVIVPIVSSIFLFPVLVFLLLCWLRKMAAKRRQRARATNRDDLWERSCASIVQRSPPLSPSLGNGCSGRFGTIDIELATTTLDVEISNQIVTIGRDLDLARRDLSLLHQQSSINRPTNNNKKEGKKRKQEKEEDKISISSEDEY